MIGNTRPYQPIPHASRKPTKSSSSSSSTPKLIQILLVFFFGCFFTSTILLHSYSFRNDTKQVGRIDDQNLPPSFAEKGTEINKTTTTTISQSTSTILNGKRILIALTSFDFSQFPLLEEVLDAYQDLCFAGASQVHVYIYTTIPYTVALIDLLNSRLNCSGMQIYIVVKSRTLRLNLVDCHRTLFYEKIDDYDLFIYSEVGYFY